MMSDGQNADGVDKLDRDKTSVKAVNVEEVSMVWWKEWIELLVRAAMWALVIYLFIFQTSIVNGLSMSHSFQNEDKLVIDKLTYVFSPIRRHDVIVFEAIDLSAALKDRKPQDYLKRVIGLPGERVVIRRNKVEINGQVLKEVYLDLDQKTEIVTGGKDTFVVPEGHYFVLGDNRKASKDSRFAEIGFVPVGQIRGLVRVRWWPWESFGWVERASK
jgi:signal peptidase I